MKKVLKILILLIRNSALLNIHGLRRFRWKLYRLYFDAPQLCVGERVIISTAHANKDAFFKCQGEVSIGESTYIDYSGGVLFGDKIAISQGVKIFTHNHQIHDGYKNWKKNPLQFSSLHIGDYVWISAGSIILASVDFVAEGSIIAAGAVLTKNTTPYGIYAGNPAKKIGIRRIDEKTN